LDIILNISSTGYQSNIQRKIKESSGWTIDEVNEMFIVTPQLFYFQRYRRGTFNDVTPRDGGTHLERTSS